MNFLRGQEKWAKIIKDGLVLWLDVYNENSYPDTGTTWTDLSGCGHNATLTNSPTFSSSAVGGYISFDGTNDYADTGKNPSELGLLQSCTFQTIIRVPTSLPSTNPILGANYNSVNHWHIHTTSTGIEAGTNYSNPLSYGAELAADVWYQITVAYDYSITKGYIYLNGSLIGSGTISNPASSSAIDLFIGYDQDDVFTGTYGKFHMSNFLIYNRCLTPSEILINYNAFKHRLGYQNIHTSNLVLRLDAGDPNSYTSGSNWDDLSGNNYDGTLGNGAVYNILGNGSMYLDGTNDYISIPGNTTIYSTDFTWQIWHFYKAQSSSNLEGLFWSEAGSKNMIIAWRDVGAASSYFRIDSATVVYQSPSDGTQYNGLSSTLGPLLNRWGMTTIVKSGTSFKVYYNDLLVWSVTISTWSIGSTSQTIYCGNKDTGTSFPSNVYFGEITMYNTALTAAQIKQNFSATRNKYGV